MSKTEEIKKLEAQVDELSQSLVKAHEDCLRTQCERWLEENKPDAGFLDEEKEFLVELWIAASKESDRKYLIV